MLRFPIAYDFSKLFRGRGVSALCFMLGVGIFIQISGKVWLVSGSARNAQVYIWLLLPTLCVAFFRLLRQRRLSVDFYFLPWAFFLLWVAVSTLWATGGDTHEFSLAKRGLFIALYLFSVQLILVQGEGHLRRALELALLMVTMGALASIVYQYIFLAKSFAYRAYRIDSLGYGGFADYGWPVAAGIFHGAAAIWVLGLALDTKAGFNKFLFWLACFAILALYVVLTYTRGALIAMGVSGLMVVFFNNSKRAWGVVVCGIMLLIGGAVVWWDKLVYEIFHRQLSGRGPIWEYFYNSMDGKWLLGHGLGTQFLYKWPGQDAVSPHAHSLYLQQIYDSGLISLFFLAFGIILLIYKSWVIRGETWVRLALPALIYALIAMMTDVERIFTRPGDYWTVFWLPVAVLLALKANSSSVAPNSVN